MLIIMHINVRCPNGAEIFIPSELLIIRKINKLITEIVDGDIVRVDEENPSQPSQTTPTTSQNFFYQALVYGIDSEISKMNTYA